MNDKKLFKGIKNPKLFILIITLIYATLTILACVSAVNDISNISTTSVGIGTVLSLVWFQICIIGFLVITYYMYSKKGNKGVILEVIIAVALILNVVANMLISGAVNSLVFLNFVIPLALLIHSFLYVYSNYIEKKQIEIKKKFNIK